LRDTQKAKRVTLSNQLLLELLSIKHQGWHFVISLDELWFYFPINHDQIWRQADQEPPGLAKPMIQDKKTMVTMACNPLGFSLVEVLPKGRNFIAEYYRDNIPTELIRFPLEAGERYLVIHADSARLHTAQKCPTFVPKMDCGPPHIRPTHSISPLRLVHLRLSQPSRARNHISLR
jgi:hypothetical protein